MSFFNEKIQVTFDSMLLAFSEALNLVDSRLEGHHKQVAYICYEFARLLGLDRKFTRQLVMLGLVHDVGAFREQERDRMVSFEVESVMEHAVTGYLLLKDVSFYAPVSKAILYHHTHYDHGVNFEGIDPEIAKMAQLIFLADRISVLVITGDDNVLMHVNDIVEAIREGSGDLFNPEYVGLLDTLERLDYFWLNIITDNKEKVIKNIVHQDESYIDFQLFMEFTKMFMQSIDFRSRYTATHSIGVSAVAKALAEYCGIDKEEAELLGIAGCYHDIGKLMIPYEILDKPEPLSNAEYQLIRQHPYYTKYILDQIDGLSYIRDISSRHHETIDGAGYPYGLDATELSRESKLMTVADIFTALTEKRPYRDPSTNEEVRQVFEKLVEKGKIDGSIAAVATFYCDALHKLNHSVQIHVEKDFDAMVNEKDRLMKELATNAQGMF